MEDYYQGILKTARQAGIEAPELLITLLWQAPQGDARRYLGRLDYLQKLVAGGPDQSQAATSRENVPLEPSLNNDRYDKIEPSGGRSREPQARTGRPGSLKRRLRQAPQGEAVSRYPFSSGATGGN